MKTLREFKWVLLITLTLFLAFIITSCSVNKEMVQNKTGAQLWGENCIRCHSIPSPSAYNDVDWETIGLHMQIRANLTQDEATKIIDFLKTAN